MLKRYSKNPILSPTNNYWEELSVMNPSVIKEKNTYNMLYRSLSREEYKRPSGKTYHRSYVGYAKSSDGINFERFKNPLLSPVEAWENLGCEDPRITKIDGIFYIFYTAVSAKDNKEINVKIACAATKDFEEIKKLGTINLPGRSKAASLFPEKINNKYVFLYTQDADSPKSTIFYTEIESINDLFGDKWGGIKKFPLLSPSKKVFRGPELGATPIKTEKGWLIIYCPEALKKQWEISAILLDLKNPKKIIGKCNNPLLKPEIEIENKGYVNNVTFPSGAIIRENELFVYYGAGDRIICLAKTGLYNLLSELTIS